MDGRGPGGTTAVAAPGGASQPDGEPADPGSVGYSGPRRAGAAALGVEALRRPPNLRHERIIDG